MLTSVWNIIAWIPLGIGLTALVILVILFTYDFTTWYIRQKRQLTDNPKGPHNDQN